MVISTIWNWYGVLFIDHPITMKEGLAIGMLLIAARRMQLDDHETKAPIEALRRLWQVVRGQFIIVGIGWIAHLVLFR